MTITDNRGPYETEERCKERIDEMAYDLMGLWTAHRMPMIFKMTSCLTGDGTEVFT
tara:strand:+ start:1462 stop:1629 length:168 start_codon:yes stop_codon:yes gene_type:complete